MKRDHLKSTKMIVWPGKRRSLCRQIEGGRSLKRVMKPLLTAAMKQKRLERGNLFLNDLKNHGNRIVIFSDEETFTVDPVANK